MEQDPSKGSTCGNFGVSMLLFLKGVQFMKLYDLCKHHELRSSEIPKSFINFDPKNEVIDSQCVM